MTIDAQVEDLDPRDLKIQQLQYALDSRVLVEQEKGILAERFGLTIPDSFELLRQAARSHQVKVQALPSQIAVTRATPLAIVDALVRVGHPHKEEFKERSLHAEQLFADLNDASLAVHRETAWSKFVCECTNPRCTDTITLSPESLAKVHAHPGHYVLKTGHQVDAVEKVIDQIVVSTRGHSSDASFSTTTKPS